MDSPQPSAPALRLIDEVRRQIRVRHYALSTESSYVYWTRFFIRFAAVAIGARWALPRSRRS